MDQEDEDTNKSNPDVMSNKKKKKNEVLLEAVDELKRTKSLTGEDLDELKGCLDLGFGFSYDEIPELCNTLPALELCYSTSPTNTTLANWKISTPGPSFLLLFCLNSFLSFIPFSIRSCFY
ncbi:GLUTATHIONE PEROXIDASE 2 family protein [Hibiscus syriacus]|uniref:GLUTATHIONE PEROXIDASE 2 family protein n=1 Tax=Hibiscus syriacus TaxID=106335 RepID=A0A6A3AMR4_HIBSY|nr:GLUTATHIONE PEROXIDASE 2 family protein [Hibiscus syriacus]